MDPAGEPRAIGRWVQVSLLAGLLLGGLLMAAGLAAALVLEQPRPEGEPPAIRDLLDRAVRGDGVGLMNLGMLALMATPVLRVAVLALGWGMERRWRFLAVALAVLGQLGVSLALGIG